MPWTAADAEKHSKDLTARQREVWARVANQRLAACLADGGTREACEASAIRQANSVAKGVRESMEFQEAATIKARLQALMRAADEYLADRDLPKSVREEVSQFRAKLRKRWQDMSDEGGEKGGEEPATKAADESIRAFLAEAKTLIDTADSYEERRRLIEDALKLRYPAPADRPYARPWVRELMPDKVIYSTADKENALLQAGYSIDRTGPKPKVTLGEPTSVEVAYVTVEANRTEDGQEYPVGAFAYVPDPEKPSTWKLRVWEDPTKKVTAAQVGRAIAAFSPGGFRGQKVDIPADDRDKVKAKLRSLWKQVNPDREASEMPAHIREAADGDTSVGGEFIPLVEKAVRRDGTISLKVIEPGWGSSGYYPKATLERDGPQVFKAGTQMYWDHPTVSEEAERPERSLRDLAGRLITDAKFRDDGPAGPGLYAEAKVYKPYQEAINELGGDIGTSIRGLGKGKQATIDGRTGPVIEKLVAARSVDFVTRPGAGGQVVELFEAARGRSSPQHILAVTLEELKRERPDLIEELRAELKPAIYGEKREAKEARKVEEAEAKQLSEANAALTAENARLKEQLVLGEAERFVAEALKSVELPELTKARLAATLAKAPVMKDGKLDPEGYRAAITEAVKAEADYLAKITGSGKIAGMGTGEPKPVNLKESWVATFRAQGKTQEEAERLAALAVESKRR